jgi:hypothetical protein
MNYLDRYIAVSLATSCSTSSRKTAAASSLLDKRQYQLAAMTCLYISIKLHEPLAMDASLLAEISAGCYTTSEILSMESHILQVLQWKLNGPTLQEYISLLLGLVNPEWYGYELSTLKELLDVSHFQCELAICDYELSIHCPPSVVALSCILNALEGIEEGCMSGPSRVEYMTRLCSVLDNGDSMDTTTMRMASLIQNRLRKLFCQNSGEEMVVRMMTAVPQDVVEAEDVQVCTVVSSRRSSMSSSSSALTSSSSSQHKMMESSSSFFYSQEVKCSSPVSVVSVQSSSTTSSSSPSSRRRRRSKSSSRRRQSMDPEGRVAARCA